MFELKKVNTPEPGKYECPTFIGEGPKYTFRERYDVDGTVKEKRHKKAYRKKSIPGPGSYNIKEDRSGPRYTFSARYRKRNSKLVKPVPGVGTYNLRNEKSLQVPSYKFDHELRMNGNLNHGAMKFPGPGTYTVSPNGVGSVGPKFSFSKTLRTEIKRPMTPGPGAYSPKSLFGKEGPKISFPKEKFGHYVPNKNTNPEPGKYFENISYIPDTFKYSIPRTHRPEVGHDKERLASPGFDIYNPNCYVSSTRLTFPSWRIGNSKRDDVTAQAKKNKYPGPGSYHAKNGLLPEGAKYTISTRLKGMKKPNYPGPGKYEVVSATYPNEPKYSIGKEQREDETKQVTKDNYPGPGKYTVKDCEMTRPISFSKERKDSAKISSVPGPGMYKIPCRFNDINNMTREKGIWDPTFRYV